MVNPSAFQGARFDFLTGEKAAYAKAVKEGYAADAIAISQRRYFKRFPIDLPHTEDPTLEFLDRVNDYTPDTEFPEIDDSVLTVEERAAELERRSARAKLIVYRKAQIRRWLAYQYMKDRDVDPKDTGEDSPLQVLRHRLTGVGLKRPRVQNPVNLWRKSVKDVIEKAARDELQALVAEEGQLPSARDHNKLAGIREKTARHMYKELSEADRTAWQEQAVDNHNAARRKYEQDRTQPLSTDPKDRQRCIEALVPFMRPILDLIVEATGMKATVIIGGPEPAYQGRINIISIHSGNMPGHVAMNFGRAERAAYKKAVVPVFGSFLCKCWTPAECHAQALESDFEGLIAMDLEKDNVNFDTVPYGETAIVEGCALTADSGSQPTVGRLQPSLPHLPAATPSLPTNMTVVSPAQPASGVSTAPSLPPANTSATARLSSPTAGLTDAPTAVFTPTPTPVLATPPTEVQTAPPVLLESPSVSLAPTKALGPLQGGCQLSVTPTPASISNILWPLPLQLTSAPNLTDEQLQGIQQAFEHHDPPSRSPSADPWAITAPGSSPAITPIPTPTASPQHEADLPSTPPITASPVKRKRHSVPSATDEDSDAHGLKRPRRSVNTANPHESRLVPVSAVVVKTAAKTKQGACPIRPDDSGPLLLTDHSNTTIPAAPVVPADAPEWYMNAVAMLSNEELDSPSWMAVLQAWQAFEVRMGFAEMLALKATHRPDAVKQWIGCRQSATWRPVVTNVRAYGQEHMKWWTALQPEWRIFNGTIVQGTAGDVSSARRSGVNGILSVVASLFYWGLHAKSARERVQWSLALEDCLEILKSK